MSHITDEDIVAALRQAVPEPPQSPARLTNVRRRAAHRRRAQLSAGSIAVVAVVAGGAIVANTGGKGAVQPSSAGITVPAGIPSALGRALHLPKVATGMPCPVSVSRTYPSGGGFTGAYQAVGAGPFSLTGNGVVPVDFTPPANDEFAGTGWPGMKVIWRIDPAYTGPVLLHGARLDGPGELRFGSYSGIVGDGVSAPSWPDPTPWPVLGFPSEGPGIRTEPSDIRAQTPGCYGLQVDGTDFSEVITFSVTSAG